MTEQRRTRDERWSTMYRNPTFDDERDQADKATLIGDVCHAMYIGITVVVLFAFVLILSGGVEAGLNLLLIVGVPLLMLAVAGEALRLWSRRGPQRHRAPGRTIFDQLAEFDQLPDSSDGQQRHHHPR